MSFFALALLTATVAVCDYYVTRVCTQEHTKLQQHGCLLLPHGSYAFVVVLCSAEEHALAATVANALDFAVSATHVLGNSSFKGSGRQSMLALQSKATATAFAGIPRGSAGPGSVAGQSMAGTVVSASVAAGGRPGSGARSQVSGVSARSKASAATAASLGVMLAKDKLTQVRMQGSGEEVLADSLSVHCHTSN